MQPGSKNIVTTTITNKILAWIRSFMRIANQLGNLFFKECKVEDNSYEYKIVILAPVTNKHNCVSLI